MKRGLRRFGERSEEDKQQGGQIQSVVAEDITVQQELRNFVRASRDPDENKSCEQSQSTETGNEKRLQCGFS